MKVNAREKSWSPTSCETALRAVELNASPVPVLGVDPLAFDPDIRARIAFLFDSPTNSWHVASHPVTHPSLPRFSFHLTTQPNKTGQLFILLPKSQPKPTSHLTFFVHFLSYSTIMITTVAAAVSRRAAVSSVARRTFAKSAVAYSPSQSGSGRDSQPKAFGYVSKTCFWS